MLIFIAIPTVFWKNGQYISIFWAPPTNRKIPYLYVSVFIQKNVYLTKNVKDEVESEAAKILEQCQIDHLLSERINSLLDFVGGDRFFV